MVAYPLKYLSESIFRQNWDELVQDTVQYLPGALIRSPALDQRRRGVEGSGGNK